MKKFLSTSLFFLLLILIAWFSGVSNRSHERCRVDGTEIIPIARVTLIDETQEKFLFCSLCCAKTWLDSHQGHVEQLKAQKATLTVVDEISGREIDGSLAYWIQSREYSRRENKCRSHVFSDKQAASKYLRQYQGQELPGYLAGLGMRLSWAKDFVLQDTLGNSHRLSAYRGKIVFIRFWSVKNPFVETDLQNLQEAQDRFREQDLVVLAVNVEDSKETVTAIMKKLALSYPVLLDPNGKLADQYRITGFPTGFLLDKSGIVDSSTIGELTADVLEPFLYSLR